VTEVGALYGRLISGWLGRRARGWLGMVLARQAHLSGWLGAVISQKADLNWKL